MTTGYRSDSFLLLFTGILVALVITCSGSTSSVSRLKTGRNEATNILQKQQLSANFREKTALQPKAHAKTSSKCKGKSVTMCREGMEKLGTSTNRTIDEGKVAFQSRQLPLSSHSNSSYLAKQSNTSFSQSQNEYLPVFYGPNGYEDVSEARSWITVPLFIFFSIIQFKILSAIFIAMFAPLLFFLLVVQGFLLKMAILLIGFVLVS